MQMVETHSSPKEVAKKKALLNFRAIRNNYVVKSNNNNNQLHNHIDKTDKGAPLTGRRHREQAFDEEHTAA